MRILPFIYCFCFFPALLLAQDEAALQPGLWRVVLQLPGGEAPFHLDLDFKRGQWSGAIINGEERILLDEIRVEDDSLVIQLHIFDAALSGKIISKGQIEGHWLKNGYQSQARVPFRALWGQKERFAPSENGPEPDFSGSWSVLFQDKEGKSYPAVGIFKQKGSLLRGTFLTSTGDYRYLEGQVEGQEMRLSTFDGNHGFLFRARQAQPGQMEGEFWSGTWSYETFTGQRNDSARLPDAESLTFLKEGYETLVFSFPNLERQMVSLQDEKYRDKVVIVQIFGSWCPNCMDETAFLAEFYKKNRAKGLEIIALAYERSPEFEQAKARLEKLKVRYAIEYDLLVAGINNKLEAAQTLPMLNAVLAFPTTIFIDRQGKVRRIHTGFEGPGTGAYYTRFVERFRNFVQQLLKE
ncbi:MAG: TlpA family protein disulfide reductase [Microscillaceae bacterium]|nr:TlpA family protein disulfide reductase [Microscillaceae bacterium]